MMLIQNEVGGLLQVKCSDDCADVEVISGAIVINIGDLLQVLLCAMYQRCQSQPNKL